MTTMKIDQEKNFEGWVNARCVASPVVSASASDLFADWLDYYHLTVPDNKTGKKAFNNVLVGRGYRLVYSSGITVKGLALMGTEIRKAKTWSPRSGHP